MTINKRYSTKRYEKAFIGVNNIAGGNRTGYPCAADAFAIVVKGLSWVNGKGNEDCLEVGHENLNKKLEFWAKKTGLPIGNPNGAVT